MVRVWLLGSDIGIDEQNILKPHSGSIQVDAGVGGRAKLTRVRSVDECGVVKRVRPELARRRRSLYRALFFSNRTQTVLITFMETDSKFQPSWWAFPKAADLRTDTSSVP